MTISEILQFINEPDKIAEIVPLLLTHSKSPNPRVRYAVFHLVSQLSEDASPDFQAAHHELITPILLEGLNDSAPRVISHACFAVNKFLRFSGVGIASQYAQTFIPKLLLFLSQISSSLIIEQSLTALADISIICKDYFQSNYLLIMPYLVNLFEKYTGNCYKTLRGKVIECITSISEDVEKEVFMINAGPIIHMMKSMQEGELENSDELVGYLLKS